jgi:Poly A polymerase head domain
VCVSLSLERVHTSCFVRLSTLPCLGVHESLWLSFVCTIVDVLSRVLLDTNMRCCTRVGRVCLSMLATLCVDPLFTCARLPLNCLTDAYRRDFTVNAMFYNIHTDCVEDFTGHGCDDLERRVGSSS